MTIDNQISSELPDFPIAAAKPVSQAFIERNIPTFKQAISFVQCLPYGRNSNKYNLITVFADNCGTCSTKHALLKELADEHSFEGMQLMTGVFKMNGRNTPRISATLAQYGLDYIPEAHNYLKFRNGIFDFTRPGSKPSDFIDDLIEEVEIIPAQITDYKVAYHKQHLENWLADHKEIHFSLAELWEIREQCIQALSAI